METIKVTTATGAVGRLFRQPTSDKFWVRFSRAGRQYRFTTGEADLPRAIEAARRLLGNPPIAAAADLDAEIDQAVAGRSANYRRDSGAVLKMFARAFAGTPIGSISTAKLQAWIDGLAVKPNTKEAYRFQVQKFFDGLVAAGKARINPAREVKVATEARSTRKTWIPKRQWAAIIEAATDLELKFILYAGFHAGLRTEEIIMFRPEWIDRAVGDFGVINVSLAPDWQPKDRCERTIPLSPEFREFLDNGFPRLPGTYMIAPFKVKKAGERYRVEFRTKWETFIRRLGLGNFTRHDMRRSFASHLVSSGVSVYKVAGYLGDDVDVVQAHYGHLDPHDDALARAMGPAPANVVPMAAQA